MKKYTTMERVTNKYGLTLQEKYWIMGGKTKIRRIIRSCYICRKAMPRPQKVPEAPIHWTNADVSSKPALFQNTSMDFAGFWYTQEHKKQKLTPERKRYMLLFVCKTYRAIHIEMLHGKDTQEFLKAFQRFLSLRNRPKRCYSDNEQTFEATSEIFRKYFQNLDHQQVQRPISRHSLGLFRGWSAKYQWFNRKNDWYCQETFAQGVETQVHQGSGLTNSLLYHCSPNE